MSAEHRPRPKIAAAELRDAFLDVAAEYDRMTVRQAYYQLTSRGVVEKIERAYKKVLYAARQLRLRGDLPFEKIVDGIRERHVLGQWDSLTDFLADVRHSYRRDRWATQPHYVEVWCEKDALGGLILPICDEYFVPFVATRGEPSLSLLHESADAMRARSMVTRIYYVGDHDPKGRGIDASIKKRLSEFDADFEFERLAITPAQIKKHRLQTRPGKRSDSCLKKFVAEFGSDRCAEADALPPDVLGQLVRAAIENSIDWTAWDAMKEVEKREQAALEEFIATFEVRP